LPAAARLSGAPAKVNIVSTFENLAAEIGGMMHLVAANVLIEEKNRYYAFGIAPDTCAALDPDREVP